MTATSTLNPNQKMLFHICLYGIKACSKEDLSQMSFAHKHKIQKKYDRAFVAINRLKQEHVNNWTNAFMKHYFPKTECTKVFVEKYGDAIDFNKKCEISFKDLDISREQVIERLIESKILPANFYQINDSYFEHL